MFDTLHGHFDMTYDERRKKALDLIRRIHVGQTRADKTVPAWHHLDRVSRLLETVLRESGEGTSEERDTIALAGLGHDALEDTTVRDEDLKVAFGERGYSLIVGMTNRHGDDHPEPYVQQIMSADEGVRLIKLADLYDNLTSASYLIFIHGLPWTVERFMPIVEPMVKAIIPTEFHTFPRSAVRLKGMVSTSHSMILDECARYKSAP